MNVNEFPERHPRSQVNVNEFPERPGQPECKFYMKTGDCKYRSSCKFHHPKTLRTSVTHSDEGLPIRPVSLSFNYLAYYSFKNRIAGLHC